MYRDMQEPSTSSRIMSSEYFVRAQSEGSRRLFLRQTNFSPHELDIPPAPGPTPVMSPYLASSTN